MRTVVIVNQKGGCGKTTTAINLAGLFASRGKRALLVDLDPQSHCAAGLAIPEQRIDFDIADALVADAPLDASRLVWSAGRNLDLIPSRTRLAGLEAARGGLATKPDKERRLARVLHRFEDRYDIALVDCSPSIGLLTYNAITAATDILVPVETGFFSLQGAMKQARTIESLQKRLESQAPFWLLPTLHEPASALAEDLLQELRRRFGDQVIPHAIRRDIKLKEAVSFGQPVIEYDPESTGARDHADLADWLLRLWQTADRQTDPRTNQTQAHIVAQQVSHARPDLPRPLPTAPIEVSASAAHKPDLVNRIAVNDHPIRSVQPVPSAVHPTPETKPTTRAEDRVAEIAALARKLRAATLETASTQPQTSGAPRTSAVQLDTSVATLEAPPTVHHRMANSVKRDMLGARATNQGVLFVQPIELGRQIAIAGDFNGWSTRSNRMAADPRLGVHQACVHLPPGRHRYRLVIDGRWTADPNNQLIEPNEFGETNSVVVVQAPRG